MRPPKVQDTEMLQGLMSVLRSKGYDGASLNELAEAAGLKKASLYHRFPNGKKEMASAVLTYVEAWIDKNIYQLLIDKSVDPEERLTRLIDNTRVLYHNGDSTCIFRALSMDSGIELFGDQIRMGIEQWIDAFTAFGLAVGFNKELADQKALQSLIDIQGSLIVAKGVGNTSIFESALQGIQRRYTKE